MWRDRRSREIPKEGQVSEEGQEGTGGLQQEGQEGQEGTSGVQQESQVSEGGQEGTGGVRY